MSDRLPTPEDEPKPCPFDCGAKITPDDFGLVKHERAAGQRACPLNNAVTDLRTWNRRAELSRSPEAPPTTDAEAKGFRNDASASVWRLLVAIREAAGQESYRAASAKAEYDIVIDRLDRLFALTLL